MRHLQLAVVVAFACSASCKDECPASSLTLQLELLPGGASDVEIVSASIDARRVMRVVLTAEQDEYELALSVPGEAAFELPTGPAFLETQDAPCGGEGCGVAYARLRTERGGAVLFEGGQTTIVDDKPVAGGAEMDGAVDLDDEDACAALFHADGGDVSLAADETLVVDVAGASFLAVSLGGVEQDWVDVPGCADCSWGTHSLRRASGYLLPLRGPP